MKTIYIEVDNLKCGGCANTVQNGLSGIPHVQSVQVDLDHGVVTVEYDEGFDVEKAQKKLASMGYPAKGTSTTFQKAKSYVSCAIGKMSA